MSRYHFSAFSVIAVLSLFCSLPAWSQNSQEAQEYNKVSIASPSAGALAKFVDIPVSLHTGIPQIDIPLYTLKEGNLEVPIGMSYHASGLKTLEPSSYVGAGWALNTGGVITRSVRGTPDEKGTVNNFQRTGFYSDYGYTSHLYQHPDHYAANDPLNPMNNLNDPYRQDYRPDSAFFNIYETFANGEYDSEPDLFFFSAGKYSGKFYFNDDRTAILLPEQDIKIEVNYTYGSSESIQGFTLTTPDGTKYYFGATPSTTDTDPVEFTKVLTDQNGLGWDKVLSSWYLNKIVSPDGTDIINFTYRPLVYSYFSMSLSPVAGSPNPALGYKLIRNYIHGVELSSITSTNAQVNFIQAAQARQDLSSSSTTGVEQVNGLNNPATAAYPLGRIDILQKSSQVLIKSYNFAYSYFDDPNGPIATTLNVSTTDRKRLKLLSIQEQGKAGTLIPPYKFDYFTEPVPRRLTFGQDNWGFINGVTSNGNNLIGTYYKTVNGTTTTMTGADREPHWPAMRAGTLNKITFPTGGYNIYDFEANQTYTSQITGTNGTRTLLSSVSAGYDGCDCTKQATLDQVIDSHAFVFQLENKPQGGGAELDIYDSNWAPIDHISASNGTTQEIQRNYAPGSYHFRVTKYNSYGGNGATVRIYQLAGVVQNNIAMVGGLRIKTITQSSGNGNPDMVTSYDYNDSSSGQLLPTGVVFGKPTIAQVTRNDIYKDAFQPGATTGQTGIDVNGCPNSPGSQLAYLLSAASIRAMDASQGSHIGYHKVTTRQTGNGYTVSIFNMDGENLVSRNDVVNRSIITTANNCTLDIPNYPAVPLPNAFKRGQLEYQAQYREDGTPLQDMTSITQYQDNPLPTPAVVITRDASSPNLRSIWSWYYQTTGRKINETTTKRSYNANGTHSVVEQSFYDSPYHHQLTRKITTNSSGDVLETRYKYVQDLYVANLDGLDTGFPSYITNLNTLTANYTSTMSLCVDDARCKRNTWFDYDIAKCHLRMNLINYRIANFTGPNNTYQTRLQQDITNAGTLKPYLDLRAQNEFNLLETVELKNDKVMAAAFNGFNYQSSSQNKIYLTSMGKTDYLVSPTSFTYVAASGDGLSLIKDAGYTDKATFHYTNGNTDEIKLTDNVPSSYVWGYNNTYPVMAAKNAKATNIFYEGFEGGAGNSTLNDCETGHYSHTGTYGVLIGNLDNGAYTLSYYKKNGSVWQYVTSNVTVTGGSYSLGLNTQVDDIRFGPVGSLLTSYTYDTEIGMTSAMDPSGTVTYYEYDEFQRLSLVRDRDKNIVKAYCYNYAGQVGNCFTSGTGAIYYSAAKSGVFTKSCGSGYTTTPVTYNVAANAYTSTVSQDDADQKAQTDVNTNGQTYANTNGVCSLSVFQYALNAGKDGATYTYTNSLNIVQTITLGNFGTATICAVDGSVSGGGFTKGAPCPAD